MVIIANIVIAQVIGFWREWKIKLLSRTINSGSDMLRCLLTTGIIDVADSDAVFSVPETFENTHVWSSDQCAIGGNLLMSLMNNWLDRVWSSRIYPQYLFYYCWFNRPLHCFPQYVLDAWANVYNRANTSLLHCIDDLTGIYLNSHELDVSDLHISMIARAVSSFFSNV